MNWKEQPTIFAVPGRQVMLLPEEQANELRAAIQKKATTKEEKELIAREVKALFTKPDRKQYD